MRFVQLWRNSRDIQIKTSVFILGNESKGISDELVRETTGTISIPLMNGIESLNVAVSAAIVAFAIQRM